MRARDSEDELVRRLRLGAHSKIHLVRTKAAKLSGVVVLDGCGLFASSQWRRRNVQKPPRVLDGAYPAGILRVHLVRAPYGHRINVVARPAVPDGRLRGKCILDVIMYVGYGCVANDEV